MTGSQVPLTKMLPGLTLVIGGAASGKSALAERLVLGTGRPAVYVATAEARDGEMAGKIARHRARRGAEWTTLEEPMEPGAAVANVTEDKVVLLDCVTLWLSNHLLAGDDLYLAEVRLLQGLAACRAPVVVVTNEVGHGIVPDHPLGRQFRAAQGHLNQRLAERADLVVAVIAGLPLILKGTWPA